MLLIVAKFSEQLFSPDDTLTIGFSLHNKLSIITLKTLQAFNTQEFLLWIPVQKHRNSASEELDKQHTKSHHNISSTFLGKYKQN